MAPLNVHALSKVKPEDGQRCLVVKKKVNSVFEPNRDGGMCKFNLLVWQEGFQSIDEDTTGEPNTEKDTWDYYWAPLNEINIKVLQKEEASL